MQWIPFLALTCAERAIYVDPGGAQSVPVFANPGDLYNETEENKPSLVLIAAHALCESVRILPKMLGLFRIVAVGPQDVVSVFAVQRWRATLSRPPSASPQLESRPERDNAKCAFSMGQAPMQTAVHS